MRFVTGVVGSVTEIMSGRTLMPTLVYPAAAPPALAGAVDRLVNGRRSDGHVDDPGVFVRIARLDAVINGGRPADAARLAGPPAVFVTIPEAIAGLPVDAVLSRVGYASHEIASSFGASAVSAVVFRYPPSVRVEAGVDGDLSSAVLRRVVPATWRNLFRTFADLAAEDMLSDMSEADRAFVASFPDWGRLRLMNVGYRDLENVGGADWYYRRLLENHLWATPSYRGDGFAAASDGGRGAPEFLGPNAALGELDSDERLAIVELG
jgi:hypothetical protein